jgi:hypothetical protein
VVTSVCLAIAWVLMVSYQIFTKTALTTIISVFQVSAPLIASWINSNIAVGIFLFSFAWMFVLSSVITNFIAGRDKRIFIQFLVSLGLTAISSVLLGVVKNFGLNLSDPNLPNAYSQLFSNAFFAFFYLSLPFIFMLAIDFNRSRRVKAKR